LSLAAALLGALGCGGSGREPPKTYPVSGKVVFKDGTPMTGGLVEFRSAVEQEHAAFGRIGSDGTFTLETLFDNQKYPGAVAGKHRVTVTPQAGDQAAGGDIPRPTTLPEVVVEPRDDNAVTLTLPSKR
jgi:hypothetical protein